MISELKPFAIPNTPDCIILSMLHGQFPWSLVGVPAMGKGLLAVAVLAIALALIYLARQRLQTQDRTQALAKELLRAKTFLNTSIDGIVVLNQQGQVVEASPSFAQMLGYSVEETLKLHVADWDTRWTRDELHQMLQGTTAMPSRFETRHRQRDGSLYDVEISYSSVVLDGAMMHFCICRDISDRKRSEAQRQQVEELLKFSQVQFKAVVANMPGMVYRYVPATADSPHRFIFVSPHSSELLGLTPEAIVRDADVFLQLIHPSDLPSFKSSWQDAVDQDRTWHWEGRIITASGQLKWVEGNSQVQSTLAGAAWNGLLLDISDRKRVEAERQRAEEELRQQKELLQAIIDHIPVMLTLYGAEGRIEFINPALERILGWSLKDWQQRDILTECYPDPAYRQSVLEHMLAATGQWKDRTLLNARGQSLETSWANVQLSGGRFLGIGQDISDRKHKEVALRRAMEAAESANRAKSQFLAKMSHELRTPLNAILGFAQVMTRTHLSQAEFHEYLGIIHRSGEHLLDLINDVLEMSRIEAGQVMLTQGNFNLHHLLQAIYDLFFLKAAQKGLTLTIEKDPSLPRYLCSDEGKLRQILINLINNAIKFTVQGHVKLRIWMDAACTPSRPSCTCYPGSPPPCQFQTLFLAVEDTGCGIPPEEWETVFEPFMQTRQGHHVEGTGLGLAISRQFAHLMGGDITVHSVPHQGSTFTCRIIAQRTGMVDEQILLPDQVIEGLVSGQPTYRILVVEDEPENQQLLTVLLQSIGFEIRTVDNGERAIAEWQAWHPHLILMDIQIPVMNGHEVTRQIRARETESHTPIIALTAYAFETDRMASLEAGCSGFLTKPFSEMALFNVLAQHLGVQYRYADLATSPDSLTPAPGLTPQDLRIMPVEWRIQVYEAALDLKDDRIRQLIADIPQQSTTLITGMTSLIDDFQLEAIATLMQMEGEP